MAYRFVASCYLLCEISTPPVDTTAARPQHMFQATVNRFSFLGLDASLNSAHGLYAQFRAAGKHGTCEAWG
jgi:hypothetical protein